MKKYNHISVVVTTENVISMTSAAVTGEIPFVINSKVTDKIRFCQSLPAEKIAAAGVSGMVEKDGILVNRWNLFFSCNYGGKMVDITGLSGFAGNNAKCIKRAQIPGSICEKCFSFIGSKFSNLPAWTKNDVILSTVEFSIGDVVLDPEKIPEARYSTHGDLINGLHAYNLFVIAASSPEVQFTLWTKNNPEYQEGRRRFFEKFGYYPKNLRVIFSPLRKNIIPTAAGLKALKAHGYDAVFSVFDTVAQQAAAVAAGAHFCKCGTGSCKYHCHYCYTHFTEWIHNDAAVLIAEILDGEKHQE